MIGFISFLRTSGAWKPLLALIVFMSLSAVILGMSWDIRSKNAQIKDYKLEMGVKDAQIAERDLNLVLLQKQMRDSEAIREEGRVITKTIYKVKEIRGLSSEEIAIAHSIIDRLRKVSDSGTSDIQGVPAAK